MSSKKIILLLLLALLILAPVLFIFSLDFATSVIPGWHTTIFPPYFIFGIMTHALLFIGIVVLCLVEFSRAKSYKRR